MTNLQIAASVVIPILAVIGTYLGLYFKFKKERQNWVDKLKTEVKEKVEFKADMQAQIDTLKMQHENLKQDIDSVKENSDKRATELVSRLDRFETKIDRLSEVIFSLKTGE